FRVAQAPPLSNYLAQLYREQGIELLLGDGIEEFLGNGSLRSVGTSSGRVLDADLAVIGIGVTPNVGFLESSGIEVTDGVVVNQRYETSVPGVYAVGDVARFHDPVFGRQRRIE